MIGVAQISWMILSVVSVRFVHLDIRPHLYWCGCHIRGLRKPPLKNVNGTPDRTLELTRGGVPFKHDLKLDMESNRLNSISNALIPRSTLHDAEARDRFEKILSEVIVLGKRNRHVLVFDLRTRPPGTPAARAYSVTPVAA